MRGRSDSRAKVRHKSIAEKTVSVACQRLTPVGPLAALEARSVAASRSNAYGTLANSRPGPVLHGCINPTTKLCPSMTTMIDHMPNTSRRSDRRVTISMNAQDLKLLEQVQLNAYSASDAMRQVLRAQHKALSAAAKTEKKRGR
jgi:hypothetical protein